jgi:hypothetical protein
MADNPMAGAASAVKKVPKWAWIAGAGVTGGVIFYRVTHRGNTADVAAPGDTTAPGDYGQTYSPLGGSGFVTSGGASDAVPVAGAPAGFSVDDVGALLQQQQANQPAPINAVDLLNSVLPFIGGGAPSSQATAAPPAAPAAAPTAPPPPAPGPAPCPAKYPFRSDRGCYQVYCAPKGGSRAPGRWHNYQSGQDQFIHGLPC